MAKKKNKHKHARLSKKPAERSKAASSAASSTTPAVSAPPATALSKPIAAPNAQPKLGILDSSNRWYYVRGDLKRIVVLASSCIALELVLWYLLAYTSFGDSIYQLIKI